MLDPKILVSSIFITGTFYVVGKMILKESEKINIKKVSSIILGIAILYGVNIASPSVIDNILKIIIIYSSCVIMYKIAFNRNIGNTILASFIMYLLLFVSEIVVDLAFLIAIPGKSLKYFQYNIIMNLLMGILTIIMATLEKEKLQTIVAETNGRKRGIVIIVLLILVTLALIIFRIPISEIKLDYNFFITLILLILFCIIGFILIKQRHEASKLTEKYKELAEYAQTNEGLLEEYRVNLHESKNQLIILDNMIPKSNKKAHEYIASLLEQQEGNKYIWLTELKYVPLPELKGFMNFKLMEMINQGLKLEINISREIDKKVFKKFNIKDKEGLYSIVGVFLDNAREASKESKEKKIAVEIYMEKEDIKLIIANTYKGKIDLEKLDDYGYSSKGNNRGTGLYLVGGIVKRSPLFEKETSLLHEYFVQTLTIHPKK